MALTNQEVTETVRRITRALNGEGRHKPSLQAAVEAVESLLVNQGRTSYQNAIESAAPTKFSVTDKDIIFVATTIIMARQRGLL